ncbi:MAG: aminoacyl-tRNA hydrolase [Clostridia bacterium]|nr:aminoacyl-tRNA hydrolase [Clostridia bacterium]MBR4186804.1 aminoacyl-tRNA hydrolase [Clostridia bacterium]
MADIFELFKKIAQKPALESGAPEVLVVGLGNPGQEYAFTRHNAGFLALDAFAEKHGVELKQLKFKALTAPLTVNGKRVLLMKPQTYMNASGEAVREAADFYKIPPERIIVISDDVAQEPGRMRIRRSGSDGGQKGLRSIIEHLGSEAFPRIRIGVGAKPHPEYEMADWVLSRIPEADLKKLSPIFACVAEAIPLLAAGRVDDAMSRFNGVKFDGSEPN